MPSIRPRTVLLVVLPLITSCNLLVPLVFVGEHTKKVLPEFDKLTNCLVVILVLTAPSTLFDYPYARRRPYRLCCPTIRCGLADAR